MTNVTAAAGLEEAYKLGWLPLRGVLDGVSAEVPPGLNLRRTLVLWRTAGVVPPAIHPQRGWLRGRRTVLWPPELVVFLEDGLRFRKLAHFTGQRHRVGGQVSARSHASLRVLLWAYGWDYSVPLIEESILYVVRQAVKLAGDASPLGFLRWFFLSSHAMDTYRTASKHRRGARDEARDRALQVFKQWGGVLTWAEFDLHKALRAAEAGGSVSFKELVRSVRQRDERLLDIVRSQARRILTALFPRAQEPSGRDVESLFRSDQPSSVGGDDWIAWEALRPVIAQVPKVLRYLGLLMAWQIAILRRAARASKRRVGHKG